MTKKCPPDCSLCAEPLDAIAKSLCECGWVQKDPNRCQKCRIFYVAHNVCCVCGADWHAIPGPHTQCPLCSGIYITWMNYPIEKPNWCRICEAEFK